MAQSREPLSLIVKLKVHAASKTASLVKKSDDSYEACVKAPAENCLTNIEALGALARSLGLNAKLLHIVKGSTSPNKIVKVLGRQ